MSLIDKPWDLQTSDKRTADTLRTFIIFCEDEHHECLYFQAFEKLFDDLKVNAIPNLRSKKLNLNATIEICRQKGLIAFTDGHYKVLPGTTEHLWCVYDRDMESEQWNDIQGQNNIDFDTSIINAQNSGLKVAWSNDAFELWILLHFEDVLSGQIRHRSYVYNRLTDIFKNEVPQNPELAQLTANGTFSYKVNMKRRERFINQVLPLLKDRTTQAINRAEILEVAFNANQPFHERNPCTMVHHLVRNLSKQL